MERIIEVDIYNENDFLELYNKKVVSLNLIDYIIERVKGHLSDNLVIQINKKVKLNCKELLIEGFKREYERDIKIHYHDSYLQFVYFFIGLFMLFLSRLVSATSYFDEILLIGAWVLIWETISIELFKDSSNRKRRQILKRLMTIEIRENNIK